MGTSTQGLAHSIPCVANAAFQTIEERPFEENVDKSMRVLSTPIFPPSKLLREVSHHDSSSPRQASGGSARARPLVWSLPSEGGTKLLGLVPCTNQGLIYFLVSYLGFQESNPNLPMG